MIHFWREWENTQRSEGESKDQNRCSMMLRFVEVKINLPGKIQETTDLACM